ncbi:MAG: alpha/beta fold hydrolase [Gammaproteobacteria bacterium]|nr:alpha/beta fold hydrolase [Gammaproteobacteria bacterium]
MHGTPSWSHEFGDVISALPDHRCVAVDHLGFGCSDKPAEADYSIRGHQRRFASTMDALDIEAAVFVLHDFGTAFALPWLLDHPDRVRGVVLTNTILWPITGVFKMILAFYATTLGRWLYRRFNISARWLLPFAWGKHSPLTPEIHAAYLKPFSTPEDRHATAALPGEAISETIAALEQRATALNQWPLRAVWGMADPLVGSAELAKWRSILPSLEVTEVDRAGHFVAAEAPDIVAAAVQALEAGATGKIGLRVS